MSKLLKNKIFLIQITVALVVSILIAMVFISISTTYMPNPNYFIAYMVWMLLALILSCIVIVISIIIGLPLRLSKKIISWWVRNLYLQLVIFIVGVGFILLSLAPGIAQKCNCESIYIYPNTIFMIVGWVLIIFIILHFNPSKLIKGVIE